VRDALVVQILEGNTQLEKHKLDVCLLELLGLWCKDEARELTTCGQLKNNVDVLLLIIVVFVCDDSGLSYGRSVCWYKRQSGLHTCFKPLKISTSRSNASLRAGCSWIFFCRFTIRSGEKKKKLRDLVNDLDRVGPSARQLDCLFDDGKVSTRRIQEETIRANGVRGMFGTFRAHPGSHSAAILPAVR